MGMIVSVNMSELLNFMCISTSACDFTSSKFRQINILSEVFHWCSRNHDSDVNSIC